MRNFQIQKIHLPREWGWTQNILIILGRILVVSLFLLLCHQNIKAQQTAIFTDDIRFYNQGLELFDKEKYAAAQKYFETYASQTKHSANKINAEYYAAVCAMELFNPDAEDKLSKIISKYPENTRSKMARFQLGKLYYRNKNSKQATATLDQVETKYLSGPDLKEYYFIYGYSLFKSDRFEDARNAFKPIKDEKSKYYDAANYYYGYVCYRSGAYDEALEHFGRVKYHKTFGPLSSVYVAQVYFARKQYRDVISFCDTISNAEIANDVAGMEGQSHFMLKEYKEAIPHLEKFMSAAPVIPGNNDYYMLAYSYAQNQQHDKAIEQYLKIESNNDTIGPYAQFNLGNSYLQLNNKSAARAAFDNSYQLDSTGDLAEAALFFSAKVSDELNLQGLAMSRYVRLLIRYPEGAYAEEAGSNLGNILLNARNYKESIRILEGIKKPGKQDLINLQRVRYYRAEELYLNNSFPEAEALFEKVIAEDYDPRMNALAHFWLAEIDFKNLNYSKCINHLQAFQSAPETRETRFYAQSFYNLGYAYLKQDNYNKAIEAFLNYENKDKAISNPEVYTDAMLRTADCYFAVKNYDKAIAYYQILIQKNLNGADYALYQKAMILGLLSRNDEKIATLKSLEKNFPKSTYIDDAVYELADIYLKSENYDMAISSFQALISNYPRSIYLRKAILNKALALFNLHRDDEALVEIKKLITNYPNSQEAREAIPLVQNIFVNQGEGEKWLEFSAVLPNVVISASTQDSLSYESAFNLFQKENYEKASKSFGNYINKFPGGYFILKANYYKAECDYKQKKYDDALVCYEYVANALRSEFSERCTRQSAVLLNMQKKYDRAYEYFVALERIAGNRDNLQVALLGQMRTCAYQGKSDSAAFASMRYLSSGVSLKDGIIEAQTYIGRYYFKQNQLDSAQIAFNAVLKETKNIYGAEAKYNIANIQYLRKEYKNAQKTILELNDKFSAFEAWIAKGFVLMADCYIRQNDLFQAKATLQSIIDNYDGQDIIDQCKLRLAEIAELEKKQKSESQKAIEQRIKQSEK